MKYLYTVTFLLTTWLICRLLGCENYILHIYDAKQRLSFSDQAAKPGNCKACVNCKAADLDTSHDCDWH